MTTPSGAVDVGLPRNARADTAGIECPRRTPFVGALIAIAFVLIGVLTWQGPQSAALAQAKASVGEFVWHDLVTTNVAQSRTFYGTLLGWTFEKGEGVDPDYTIIKQDGLPIGGIVQLKQPEAATAQWLSYVVVSDVDRAVETFRQSGGKVFRGPLNARKDLRVAAVADAQGAPLGLASRGPLVSADGPPSMNRWLWMEYVARDVDGALKFYGDSLGYANEVSEKRDSFTYYLLTSDRPRAGLFRAPSDRDTSLWLPYVRVADPAALAKRVVELGGQIVLEPRASVRKGSLAIVLDPTGAPLALQKYPFDTE